LEKFFLCLASVLFCFGDYKSMCPPTGTHHYHFKVYALDAMLNLDKNSSKAELEAAMKDHTLAEGDLVGLYAKTK
jgi:Raf kinase inhibitor-like YbhB/YbcL family protein